MAQGGDPTGTGTGRSDLPNLPAEFTDRYRFVRGVCGMARSQDPNSANSQFFIMFGPAPSLDRQYTVWGRVVAGMDVVDKIKRGDPGRSGTVQTPDRLIRARLTGAGRPRGDQHEGGKPPGRRPGPARAQAPPSRRHCR